jgi:hypothetical protein
MPPTSPDSLILTGSTALIVSMVIQYFKNAQWFPWLSRETEKLNRFVSIAAAFLTTAGIHWGYNAATDTLNIVGLHTVWLTIQHWVAQQTIYKQFIVLPEAQGEIRAINRNVLATLQAILATHGVPPPPPVSGAKS